jgi:hypothetical protein
MGSINVTQATLVGAPAPFDRTTFTSSLSIGPRKSGRDPGPTRATGLYDQELGLAQA